jgi:hypothetical protein
MENSSEETKEPEHTNIQLIYDYTEYRLKLANDSLNALNTKLGSIIAFSGVSIGLSINLPSKAFTINSGAQYICYSCFIIKIIVCIFLIAAIVISLSGFTPIEGGGMTPPSLLMNENYYDSDEDCRLIITKTWIEALKELETLRDSKANQVKMSILALGGAAISAAFSVILASVLSII